MRRRLAVGVQLEYQASSGNASPSLDVLRHVLKRFQQQLESASTEIQIGKQLERFGSCARSTDEERVNLVLESFVW